MKFRQLNAREKNMGFLVFSLSLMIIAWGISSRKQREMVRLSDEVTEAEEKFNKTKTMIDESVVALAASRPRIQVAPSGQVQNVDRKATLHFLRDLTVPEMVDKVKIISAEKKGDAGYTLTVEGEFTELMRFMSFLERKDGKFLLEKASIAKVSEDQPGGAPQNIRTAQTGPSRRVQAIFQLNMKG
jgi:hypothetical protein